MCYISFLFCLTDEQADSSPTKDKRRKCTCTFWVVQSIKGVYSLLNREKFLSFSNHLLYCSLYMAWLLWETYWKCKCPDVWCLFVGVLFFFSIVSNSKPVYFHIFYFHAIHSPGCTLMYRIALWKVELQDPPQKKGWPITYSMPQPSHSTLKNCSSLIRSVKAWSLSHTTNR